MPITSMHTYQIEEMLNTHREQGNTVAMIAMGSEVFRWLSSLPHVLDPVLNEPEGCYSGYYNGYPVVIVGKPDFLGLIIAYR